MSNIIKLPSSSLGKLFHDKKSDIDIPKPFERDIFLFETHVAGTMYIDNIDDIEQKLNIGEKLEFFREPENVHDKRAIVIKTIKGIKIGYVPKHDNIVFSRLMDAGKLLFAKVKEKEKVGNWHRFAIEIFLHE